MKRWLLLLPAMLFGCPQFAPDDVCGYPGFCDGSVGDAGGDAGPCDPKIDASCVGDGVYVSAKGNDSNDGTKTSPIATLSHALDLAKSKAKANIYVCSGTYAGSIKIDNSIAINGGFECANWTYTGDRPQLNADTSDYVIKVTANNVTLTDLILVGKDGGGPGESSIGLSAVNANAVALIRLKISAGKGVTGAQPAAQPDFSPTQADAGAPGVGTVGGVATTNNCANGSGTSIGGAGGSTSTTFNGKNGSPFSQYPINPVLADGAGGTSGSTCIPGAGHDGSYGPGGDAGAPPQALGTLDSNGWHPAPGGSGGGGLVGEGGGGGAVLTVSGSGGGGGPGGCGGSGGAGGGGGGGSIDVLALTSAVTLTSCELITGSTGDGGQGGSGQRAELGGLAAMNGGAFNSDGCSSGGGGAGGSGGGGGGGAGGISVGILWKGTAPTVDGISQSSVDTLTGVTVGSPGQPGLGGAGGAAAKAGSNAGSTGNAGVAGVAKAVFQAP